MKLSALTQSILNPSVKESIDNLPMGLCCYWPGGLVKLKNRRMEELSFALTGESLTDGEGFWRILAEGGARADCIETGENPVLRLTDGTVCRFQRCALLFEGKTLYEVLALDQTSEYDRNQDLREKRARVAAMVERQRQLNREIETMIREREILAAKTRVHDDLSRALLAGRQYLTHAEPPYRQELIDMFVRSLHILRREGADEWRDGLSYARETARSLGMRLETEGAPPEERRARGLLCAAIVTCLSNALRHAGADTVTARFTQQAGFWRVEIENNGKPPECEIAETGGLADLRRRVEAAGGTMALRSLPRFQLAVTISEGGKPYGL